MGLFASHPCDEKMKVGSTLGEAGLGGKMAGFGIRSCRQNWQGLILNHPCPILSLRCSGAAGSPRRNAAGPGDGLRFVERHQQGLPTSLVPSPDATPWPCMGDKDLCCWPVLLEMWLSLATLDGEQPSTHSKNSVWVVGCYFSLVFSPTTHRHLGTNQL